MNSVWTSHENAQRIVGYAGDARPAWLWTGDGARLVWQNHAATLFGARIKGGVLRRIDDPQPIKGQTNRILRIGLTERPMLSRVQFIAGRKPLSATCMCTPLDLGAERPHVLIVGIDAIPDDILTLDPIPEDVHGGPDIDAVVEEQDATDGSVSQEAAPIMEQGHPEQSDAPEEEAEYHGPLDDTGLARLIDRLAEDEELFAPLSPDDDPPDEQIDTLPPPGVSLVPPRNYSAIAFDESVEAEHQMRGSDWPDEEDAEDEATVFAADSAAETHTGRSGLWQVIGRGLIRGPEAHKAAEEQADQVNAETPEDDDNAPDVDRASRYNFEELSRILIDRVGSEPTLPPQDHPQDRGASGALVALSEETLVLNRLPLGILIFRDQDIVFANRALVEMTGYENAASLRALGLSAVFPNVEAEEAIGPVSHLMRRDGSRLAISARLQSITWHGRAALMLSASEQPSGPLEGGGQVRRFAALAARTARQVFFESDARGLLTQIVLGQNTPPPSPIAVGARIEDLVAPRDKNALQSFMSAGEHFEEAVRPAITLAGLESGQTITLFAEGEGHRLTGYFGIIDRSAPRDESSAKGLPTESLSRISRELRRPLNTIAGFSELIATEAFGPIENSRYIEYARDIRSAGSAIAALADELDDFVRLAEGRMTLGAEDIDLIDLLDGCMMQIRGAAGAARVLLRSAVSESLPHVQADKTTLRQAVLNMLASAINQAGEGAKVVLSAQLEADGAVTIHVRDGVKAPGTLADQFVVFRDGLDKEGKTRQPMVSSIGLTLTRSLVAVNACSLRLDPTPDKGTLMTLTIPATLVVEQT